MIGQRIGRLTVTARSEKSDRYGRYWVCRCDCGKTHEARGVSLRRGSPKSCGCLVREREEVLGQKFGNLTVIGPALPAPDGYRDTKKQFRLCRCDCGTEKVIVLRSLKSGLTTSCGCVSQAAIESRRSIFVGATFASLTAVERLGDPDAKGHYNWRFRCACGTEISTYGRTVVRGQRTSCGCLKRERFAFENQIREQEAGGWDEYDQ